MNYYRDRGAWNCLELMEGAGHDDVLRQAFWSVLDMMDICWFLLFALKQ